MSDASDNAAERATKQCSRCGQTKPLSGFRIAKSYRDGRRAQCTECLREIASAYNKSPAGVAAVRRYIARVGRRPRPRGCTHTKEYARLQKLRLAIGYVKDKLARQLGVRSRDVPHTLVEVKRIQLETRRLARQLRKETK